MPKDPTPEPMPGRMNLLDYVFLVCRYAWSHYAQHYVGPGTAWAYRNNWTPRASRQFSISYERKTNVQHAQELSEELRSPIPLALLRHLVRWVMVDFSKPPQFARVARAIQRYRNAMVVHYLTCPPNFFELILNALKVAGVLRLARSHWLLFEKPFGFGPDGCRKLLAAAKKVFRDRVRLIDHYLLKEKVVALPEAGLDEAQRNALTRMLIQISEPSGITGRGGMYFDSKKVNGLQTDFVSHVLVVLAEFLRRFADTQADVQAARQEVVEGIRILRTEEEIRANTQVAQYLGYLNEDGVRKDSNASTYFVWRLEVTLPHINGGRPFEVLIEVGKAMAGPKLGIIRAEFDESSGLPEFKYDFQERTPDGPPEHARLLTEIYQEGVLAGAAEEAQIAPEAKVQGGQFHFVAPAFAIATWDAMFGVIEYWNNQLRLPQYEPGSGRPTAAQSFFPEGW